MSFGGLYGQIAIFGNFYHGKLELGFILFFTTEMLFFGFVFTLFLFCFAFE